MTDPSILWKYSLFSGLDQGQVGGLLPLMGQEEHEAGKDILVEGANNNKIYFVVEGRVAIKKGLSTISELEAGGSFGEMEILDVSPAHATAKALTATKLITLSMDALGEIYESDLRAYAFILMNLARDLSRRLREKDKSTAGSIPRMEWS